MKDEYIDESLYDFHQSRCSFLQWKSRNNRCAVRQRTGKYEEHIEKKRETFQYNIMKHLTLELNVICITVIFHKT